VLPCNSLRPRKGDFPSHDGGAFVGLVLNSSILKMLGVRGRISHLSMAQEKVNLEMQDGKQYSIFRFLRTTQTLGKGP